MKYFHFSHGQDYLWTMKERFMDLAPGYAEASLLRYLECIEEDFRGRAIEIAPENGGSCPFGVALLRAQSDLQGTWERRQGLLALQRREEDGEVTRTRDRKGDGKGKGGKADVKVEVKIPQGGTPIPFVCVSLSVGRCLGTTTAVTGGPPALTWTARTSARRGTTAVGARSPASVALSMRATSDCPRGGRAAARTTAVSTTTHATMVSRRSACDHMASHTLLLNFMIHGFRIQGKTGPAHGRRPKGKTFSYSKVPGAKEKPRGHLPWAVPLVSNTAQGPL